MRRRVVPKDRWGKTCVTFQGSSDMRTFLDQFVDCALDP